VNDIPFETFAPLTKLPGIVHAFTLRTTADTKAAGYEEQVARFFGYHRFARADQPHGTGVAIVPGPATGVDALVTRQPGLPLLIRCADCAPVFLVDPVTPTVALIHSGKKGTLANVTGATLATMRRHFGTRARHCLAVIGPCIGPCHYELDIPATIEAQLRAAGVTDIHNLRVCTACHRDRYFSYRAEQGQTGRMFALLALRPVTRPNQDGRREAAAVSTGTNR
jgi:copper oxidase (laccase) domain-containing protein